MDRVTDDFKILRNGTGIGDAEDRRKGWKALVEAVKRLIDV